MRNHTQLPATMAGGVAAVVLTAALAVVLLLGVVVTVAPQPLGGVALLAIVLGLAGVGAGAYLEGAAR